jgi:hypothetical protein
MTPHQSIAGPSLSGQWKKLYIYAFFLYAAERTMFHGVKGSGQWQRLPVKISNANVGVILVGHFCEEIILLNWRGNQ